MYEEMYDETQVLHLVGFHTHLGVAAVRNPSDWYTFVLLFAEK